MLVITKEQQAKLQSGENVSVYDTTTGHKVIISLIDNEYHAVASKLNAYTKVNPYLNKPYELNLTQKETLECMKNGSVTVYRSSGAREEDKALTREEQVKRGLAREIIVICDLAGKDKNNPMDYIFSIFKDTSLNIGDKLEDIVVIG